ncbi:transcriptional regulator, TraR/DksA family [Rhizobium sp. RU35A]|uniref:TraR/DksA C4-type zinc finger protein n=1 Tax=Rhizobium sp. RU35A TaxID=1907414 RepID=UPI0009540AB8|nr:TraR/DksA C4-type zinc finger protein [Rhizobium sp. RU35A]SIQ24188.1 transcriptional regulator, TraR/DksA family [Rhizobium sp. RU35A]
MYSEFDREIGEMRVEQERQARIDAARRALKQEGREECECGATISAARRRVYPSATRCLECQEIAEKEAYLR